MSEPQPKDSRRRRWRSPVVRGALLVALPLAALLLAAPQMRIGSSSKGATGRGTQPHAWLDQRADAEANGGGLQPDGDVHGGLQPEGDVRAPATLDAAQGMPIGANTGPDAGTGAGRDGGLARIDPSTSERVGWIRFVGASGLALGHDAVWVTRGEGGFHTAARIDPLSSAVTKVRIAPLAAAAPRAIAVGEGAVWAIAGEGIYRIHPQTDREIVRVRGLPAGSNLGSVAAGGGAVWVTDPTKQRLYRIDPETNRVVSRVRVPHPGGVAVGQGSVWVTSMAEGSVFRLDPSTARVIERIAAPGASFDIAAAAGGVWLPDARAGALRRIDARSGEVEVIRVGRKPTSVAVSGETVWVVNSLDGTVSAVDARRRSVRANVAVGPRPYLVAASEGAVWVAVLGTPDLGHGH